MTTPHISLLPKLVDFIQSLDQNSIPEERKPILQELIDYLSEKLASNQELSLNFICTHNSRRSQLAQVWAQVAVAYFDLPVKCYSGGVEVTACNPRTLASLERTGFRINKKGKENPRYRVSFSEEATPVECFSKLYDDPANPKDIFAAVMTCSHADENCPFIPGAEKRIALNYDDPKVFDGTPQEAEKYDERSRQIATEMFYVISVCSSEL